MDKARSKIVAGKKYKVEMVISEITGFVNKIIVTPVSDGIVKNETTIE